MPRALRATCPPITCKGAWRSRGLLAAVAIAILSAITRAASHDRPRRLGRPQSKKIIGRIDHPSSRRIPGVGVEPNAQHPMPWMRRPPTPPDKQTASPGLLLWRPARCRRYAGMDRFLPLEAAMHGSMGRALHALRSPVVSTAFASGRVYQRPRRPHRLLTSSPNAVALSRRREPLGEEAVQPGFRRIRAAYLQASLQI